MANYNRIELIGYLTRDPELSYLPSQTPVVNFGLAVNRNWKDKTGNERKETLFIECSAFAGAAEVIAKYVKKGHLIFIYGRLGFDEWTSKDGQKQSRYRVLTEGFQLLPNREHNNNTSETEDEYGR